MFPSMLKNGAKRSLGNIVLFLHTRHLKDEMEASVDVCFGWTISRMYRSQWVSQSITLSFQDKNRHGMLPRLILFFSCEQEAELFASWARNGGSDSGNQQELSEERMGF